MDAKTRHLIGIGAAAGANCIPCYHALLELAHAAGARDEEIRIAVGVGQRVRQGAAGRWDDQVQATVGKGADVPCPLSEPV
jgi:alkylhydroperoxidase/carboxymuconolactone decarboxylase family protein YurZ